MKGHAWQRGCMVKGAMCDEGGCIVKGGAYVAWGACMAGETASATDGTHPTGMHSCQ